MSANESPNTPAAPPSPGANDPARPLTFAERVLTPGHGIALLVTLAFIYYAWGVVFQRNGTGSNVVLGLLMAFALLYLLTTHLGSTLDALVFGGGQAQAIKDARFLVSDLSRSIDRAKADAQKRGAAKVSAAKKGGKLSADDVVKLDAALAGLQDAIRTADAQTDLDKAKDALAAGITQATTIVEQVFGAPQSALAQIRSLGFALVVALVLRAFVVEPFQIPSGSMIPTLLVGDHLFVARFMYGLSLPYVEEPQYLVRWSVPEPGDVVVFVAPEHVERNAGEDWIKRVIAGPGQHVRMEQNVLYVDDKPYTHVGEAVRETYKDYNGMSWPNNTAHRVVEEIPDFGPHETYLQGSYTVKKSWPRANRPPRREGNGLECTADECVVQDGYIFVMGDNRDDSADGRAWGAVPIDNVKGKALFIWMSVDGSEHSVDLGRFTLPGFRWSRLFQGIQ